MSYGGNADPTGVQVTFLDQTGAKSVKAVIAFSVPVSRIIPNIITKMNLPANSPDGTADELFPRPQRGRASPSARELDIDRRGSSEWRSPDRLPRSGGRPGLMEPVSQLGLWPREAASLARAHLRRTRRFSLRPRGTRRPCINLLECAASVTTGRPWIDSSPRAPSSDSRPKAIYRSFIKSRLKGTSLWRDRGPDQNARCAPNRDQKLGSSYPRTVPEIRWLTPIYHPNISEIGMVCLGGYGTHWVPSVQLDELCIMLWDMGALQQLRHQEPVQPRCGALGGEPDQVSVPDRSQVAPRQASIPGSGSNGPGTRFHGPETTTAGRRQRARECSGPGWSRGTSANPRVRESISCRADQRPKPGSERPSIERRIDARRV